MYFDDKATIPAQIDARRHAIAVWPNESCGIILKTGEYVPLPNVAADPENSFNCHDARLPYVLRDEVAAMVHSHPYQKEKTFSTDIPCDFGPSAHDMRQQLADGFPWGLIATNGKISSPVFFWGDTIKPVPLLGRQFRHGPSGTDNKGDCYALIKDYYKQELGIDLPEGPRDPDWWHHKENLYIENMTRAGFKTIPAAEARPGDVFFAQVNASVPNHGGILLDNGLVLHHLYNRMSRKEPLLGWRKHIVRWIKHEKRN